MLQKLNKNRGGFTLVEIMIVVAIIALLAAIAVPNFLRARKRSQATRILEDLRIIDSAQDQYAIENNKTTGNSIVWTDIQAYLKNGSVIYNSAGIDLLGNTYNGNAIVLGGQPPEAQLDELQQALRRGSSGLLVALLSLNRDC